MSSITYHLEEMAREEINDITSNVMSNTWTGKEGNEKDRLKRYVKCCHILKYLLETVITFQTFIFQNYLTKTLQVCWLEIRH